MAFVADHPAKIAEQEAQLEAIQTKLLQIEDLKRQEPRLRNEAAALEISIAELKSELEFHGGGQEEEEEEREVKKPSPKVSPKAKPAPSPAVQKVNQVLKDLKGETPEDERKRRLKALNKKIQQIEKLKMKDDLDAEAAAKVASEPALRKEIAALERGEDYVVEEEPNPQAAGEPENMEQERMQLPTDPAEVEKKLKVLKKKIQQIEKLKEKDTSQLDAEALAKVNSHRRLVQEVAALERGDTEVVFDDEKIDAEKRLRALNKKLEQVQKIKAEGPKTDDERKKLTSIDAIKKEHHEVQMEVAEMNRKERERVAERLGWTDEAPKAKAKAKGKKK